METSLTWLGRLIESPTGADWQRLQQFYAPLLASWANRSGVPPHDVDDIVQETFMVIVRRVSEFEHQHPGAFRGWLRAILANHLKRYFREHQLIPCVVDLDSLCDERSALAQLIDREHNEHLVC